jgi:energy-coupling factor transport system ATP-binding protein
MAVVFKKVSHVFMPGSPFMTTAIKEIDLTIEDGSFVGLIGHTGSGKSTLIQHINGLLKPTSGVVEVGEINTASKGVDMMRLRRQVGLVFQYPEHQLFEETVERDIAFGPRNMGLTEDEIAARVRKALQQVGLPGDEILTRSPFELSGGQRRRVAIAGVLAMEPQVLILDEPTAGLDPRGREEVLALVKSIHEGRHCTIIMVSHSMDEVAQVASRVIVMNRAEIAIDGTPREVFERSAELREMGLDIPAVAMLCTELRQRGLDVPPGIMTLAELKAFVLDRLGVAAGV